MMTVHPKEFTLETSLSAPAMVNVKNPSVGLRAEMRVSPIQMNLILPVLLERSKEASSGNRASPTPNPN